MSAKLCARRAFATFARSSSFAQLTDVHTAHFRALLGGEASSAAAVVTDADALAPMNRDWMNKYHGKSTLALRPSSTEQVAAIMRYCNEQHLAVVPQGGNTGLVGGSVPVHDEIILSLQRMSRIESFDAVSGVLVCEAGCVLEALDTHLSQHGFMMPLDLGAKGSCMIGGNVSTNAGGLRLVRYGSLHGTVLGVEVVLADGRVLDLLTTLRKDNTGYDLKQLFIGAEGTLGVVTRCAILVPRRPQSTQVAYLACASYEKVLETMCSAREKLGEIISAIEFQDRRSLELVLQHAPSLRDPLAPQQHAFYVLIETAGSDATHDQEKVARFLETAMESGSCVDGTLAADKTQLTALWQLRERVAEAAGKSGSVYKYDVSLPTPLMYKLVEEVRAHMQHALPDAPVECVGYGHVGDGNIHLNVIAPKYERRYLDAIEPFVFERVAAHRGSISAEHGIGVGKPHFLHHSKSKDAIECMRALKTVFDPRGILNPYKVLPPL